MSLKQTACENWQNFKECCEWLFVKPVLYFKKFRRKRRQTFRLIENPVRRETIIFQPLDLNEAEIDQILARIGNDFTFSGEGK